MNSIKRLIPNLLTAGNLVGGILAIIFALTGRIDLAPWCIFASAIFDFLDGFAARLLKVQNELGKQLDSLADMVTFGVAPGVMVYSILKIGIDSHQEMWILPLPNAFSNGYSSIETIIHQTTLNYYSNSPTFLVDIVPYLAFIIPIFALFRLAKFNLDTRQSDAFIGLPTPAMTLFFAVIPLLVINGISSDVIWQNEFAKLLIHPVFLVVSSVIMSVLMVVELPLFALKFKGFGWTGNEIRYTFLTISLILFVILLFWSIPLIIILYLILSIITNSIHKKNEV